MSMIRRKLWKEAEAARNAAVERGFAELRDRYTVDLDGYLGGPGWLPLLDDLIFELTKAEWDRELYVKSTGCSLKVYTQGGEVVQHLVEWARSRCDRACEFCGKDHSLRIPRVGIALCKACEAREESLYG